MEQERRRKASDIPRGTNSLFSNKVPFTEAFAEIENIFHLKLRYCEFSFLKI